MQKKRALPGLSDVNQIIIIYMPVVYGVIFQTRL